MEINKAVDIIKNQLYVQNPTIKEALELVMDAAKRQVARPPIFMDTSHLVDEVMYMSGFYICPHCGAYAAGSYCDNCGQKFDWETIKNENKSIME